MGAIKQWWLHIRMWHWCIQSGMHVCIHSCDESHNKSVAFIYGRSIAVVIEWMLNAWICPTTDCPRSYGPRSSTPRCSSAKNAGVQASNVPTTIANTGTSARKCWLTRGWLFRVHNRAVVCIYVLGCRYGHCTRTDVSNRQVATDDEHRVDAQWTMDDRQ